MDAAKFKHIHSQVTQELIDAIIEMGPDQYTNRVNQILHNLKMLKGGFIRDIFAFGAAELYFKAREKLEVVAELEDK